MRLLTISLGMFLGLTAHSSVRSTHVSSSVYIAIIVLQCCGFILASFLQSPVKVRRNDGRAIALFPFNPWKEELIALPKSLLTPRVLLISLALFSCQMNSSFNSSLNAFYFNARTRALVNVCLIDFYYVT